MNQFKEVIPSLIRKNPFQAIGKEWMLITAGNQEKVNTMTASWGGLGVMYGKDVAFVVVRPQRYTREFIDREETFSLSFLDKKHRDTLNYLGSVSGRTEDKIKKSGLTLEFDNNIPYFAEANQIFLCKKLVKQELGSDSFLIPSLDSTYYPNNDYHILYIVEIVKTLQAKRQEAK